MAFFECSFNPNLTCLPELKTITNLAFIGNFITCLPNYGSVAHSNPSLNSLPLCGIFNPTGCTVFWNVSGQSYYDSNANCAFDSSDVEQGYVKVQLDSGGVLQQQVFTGGEGFYSFKAAQYGTYTVTVDTSSLPFTVNCPASTYYTDALSVVDSLFYNNDFAFKCRSQGFDIGVQSVINNIIPRPASIISVYTKAGDMSALYGAHCSSGISGQVQITYTGQIHYMGPASGALTPSSVSGNTISWTIADFGTVQPNSAFNLIFQVDSYAIAGSPVCINVGVTPTANDYNPSNNNYNYCFSIVNALDPNEKEVYPSGALDTSQHWLTYTIRFQNTGTAPAVNIYVTDTLESNLDPSTIQLLTYSAKNLTQVFGNVVVFNFPNINLPDSATSDIASRGYVQFKVKLKDNLSIGTQISNNANIYFDLNPPVVTNTVTNSIGHIATGIPAANTDKLELNIYPNPASTQLNIQAQGFAPDIIFVYGINGQKLAEQKFTPQLNIGQLSPGIYFIEVRGNGDVVRKRFVKIG